MTQHSSHPSANQSHFEIVMTRRENAELLSFEPRTVGAGEVGGPTLASLISAGTELSWGYTGENFPARTGYAAVFRVEEIGAGVENFQIGDLVLAMGEHRSHQVHPARDVYKVPEGLGAQDATFARLMGVSMSSLVTTTARPPEKVIVTGLGPVGHLAAQLFAACGYEVLGFDPDAGRRELAARGGIAQICEKLPLDDPQWQDKVALVLECSGHEGATLDACRLVKKRGEVVLIGVPWRQRTQIFAHELLNVIFHRYAVVRSGWEWEVPRHATDFQSGSIDSNLQASLKWLAQGKVRVGGLYSTFSPRDCQAAYQSLLQAQEKNLAIVFDWTALSS